MKSILEIRHLCKTYPSFSLNDVSFSVNAGSIMGFIGRNGAGKTTTLKSILHLVHPDSGSIRFFDEDFAKNEHAIKQRIGYATGSNIFYPRKKVGEVISVTRSFYESWDDDACRHYLELFSLDDQKKVTELSEGMKVKFSLALALSHHAELLILDEPTSGLDPVSRDELLEIFSYLAKRDVAILFSTHITSDLEKCADAITYIKQGSIIASKSLDDFLQDHPHLPNLEEIMIHLEKKP